jgi:PA domain
MFEWTFPFSNNVRINAPPAIAGNYAASGAEFGPQLSDTGPITGNVTLVNDGTAPLADGCQSFDVPDGTIAMVDRGSCNFTVKVKNAQTAGAVAVIVVQSRPAADRGRQPVCNLERVRQAWTRCQRDAGQLAQGGRGSRELRRPRGLQLTQRGRVQGYSLGAPSRPRRDCDPRTGRRIAGSVARLAKRTAPPPGNARRPSSASARPLAYLGHVDCQHGTVWRLTAVLGVLPLQQHERTFALFALVEHAGATTEAHPPEAAPILFIVVNEDRDVGTSTGVLDPPQPHRALRFAIDGRIEGVALDHEHNRHEMRPSVGVRRCQSRHPCPD